MVAKRSPLVELALRVSAGWALCRALVQGFGF